MHKRKHKQEQEVALRFVNEERSGAEMDGFGSTGKHDATASLGRVWAEFAFLGEKGGGFSWVHSVGRYLCRKRHDYRTTGWERR